MESKTVKIVVTVPETHANMVREAIGKAGGGKIGNYSFCSFSTKGVGRFLAGNGAKPGEIESVLEERIEVTCGRDIVSQIVSEIKKVHPYEEVTIDIYSIETP